MTWRGGEEEESSKVKLDPVISISKCGDGAATELQIRRVPRSDILVSILIFVFSFYLVLT